MNLQMYEAIVVKHADNWLKANWLDIRSYSMDFGKEENKS